MREKKWEREREKERISAPPWQMQCWESNLGSHALRQYCIYCSHLPGCALWFVTQHSTISLLLEVWPGHCSTGWQECLESSLEAGSTANKPSFLVFCFLMCDMAITTLVLPRCLTDWRETRWEGKIKHEVTLWVPSTLLTSVESWELLGSSNHTLPFQCLLLSSGSYFFQASTSRSKLKCELCSSDTFEERQTINFCGLLEECDKLSRGRNFVPFHQIHAET